MMTLEYNSKMSIGWFCLHEGLQKNEHEKTLLYYRLIMHSYGNNAFFKQVKGELYYFFNELEEAKKQFNEAFDLYIFEEKILYAFILVLKMKLFEIEINSQQQNLYKKMESFKKYALFFE